ncbi:DUF927 domain-containing protein [Aneurinibacillus sp. Ricciae_BoGa-3]|uniref:DUF927 domain-containing protein n=1 Tax=Aneurinibacillus sp. Ricciae_BoGa-3 TaxID=3022697 RepID=UPI00234018E7|nr:DUF927 domain-containing protein [Aneurinibacillus sp. Ricciae_BoGa-3]WCK53918.1 DUF927 domain-containing protein [Aneurinibacillus sp. Ricciae_BoGa-3]
MSTISIVNQNNNHEQEVKEKHQGTMVDLLQEEEALQHSQVRISSVLPNHPINIDLIIPEGFMLNPANGIVQQKFVEGKIYSKIAYPSIVLPYQIIKDSADTTGDKLIKLIKYDAETGTWEHHPFPVSIKHLVSSKEIIRVDGAGIIVFGEDYKKPMASFFLKLIHSNKMLKGLKVEEAVSVCGWTSKGDFFPFTTKSDITFIGEKGTTVFEIDKTVKTLPKGNYVEAIDVLTELRDNAVFLIMLAGCLASPLVSKLEGVLDENIGIDLYGKTTSGKTTIQTIAINLVYGLGDALKKRWGKSTQAGIWGFAKEVNNLPFVLDDSHRMNEKRYEGVPHDLINGNEGSKQVETGKGRWQSRASGGRDFNGVIFFNGEISIATKVEATSAGIFGRILLVNEPPFPKEFDAKKVEALSLKSLRNGGQFAKTWLKEIGKLDSDALINQVQEVSKLVSQDDDESLVQRLRIKAALLIWSLEKFKAMVGVQLNVEAAVDLLNRSMRAETKQVNIADRIMREIIERIWGIITALSPNIKDKDYMIAVKNDLSVDTIVFNGIPTLYYKTGEFLVLKQEIVESILQKKYGDMTQVRQLLYVAGFIKSNKLQTTQRPRVEGETAQNPRITGIKFFFDSFEKFIPRDEDENGSSNVQQEKVDN